MKEETNAFVIFSWNLLQVTFRGIVYSSALPPLWRPTNITNIDCTQSLVSAVSLFYGFCSHNLAAPVATAARLLLLWLLLLWLLLPWVMLFWGCSSGGSSRGCNTLRSCYAGRLPLLLLLIGCYSCGCCSCWCSHGFHCCGCFYLSVSVTM